MRKTALILLLILLCGCPENIDPPELPPPGVRIIDNDNLVSPIEQGLRSVAGSPGNIIVEWTEIDQPGVLIAEYIVHRSKLSAQNDFVIIGNTPDDFFLDQNANTDTTYYYYVTARDSRGNLSDTSLYFSPDSLDTYVKSIRLGKPVGTLAYPVNLDDSVGTKPRFRWIYGSAGLPFLYYVKVANLAQQVLWIARVQSSVFDVNAEEFLTFNHASYSAGLADSLISLADVAVIYVAPGIGPRLPISTGNSQSYLWRVDAFWGQNHESRKGWQSFTATKYEKLSKQ